MVDRNGKKLNVGDTINHVGANWVIKIIHESGSVESICISKGSRFYDGRIWFNGSDPEDFELIKKCTPKVSHFPKWW